MVAKGNGLPITVSRHFFSGAEYGSQTFRTFGDWMMNVPLIQNVYLFNSTGNTIDDWSKGRECSGSPYATATISELDGRFSPSDHFNGVTLLLASGEKQKLLKNTDGTIESNTSTFPWVSKSNWKFSCISRDNGTGEGFVGYSPQGLKITFDKSVKSNPRFVSHKTATITKMTISLLASKIEDRFGNSISYIYDELNRLTQITANDGRNITFSYSGYTIQTMTYNGRVWTYIYNDGSLVEVKDPEDQSYLYDLADYAIKTTRPTIAYGGCGFDYKIGLLPNFQTDNDITASVKAPNGLYAVYTLSPRLHGRSNVRREDDGAGGITTKICTPNHALIKKTLSGPGSAPKTWTYHYSNNGGFFNDSGIPTQTRLTGVLPSNIDDINYNATTITSPENEVKVKYFNRDFASFFEGALSAESIYDASGSLISQAQYTFNRGNRIGYSYTNDNAQSTEYQSLQDKVKTLRYYNASADSYTTEYSLYDVYGFYGKVKESNSFSANQKYTTQTYHHDVVNWLLGNPEATAVSTSSTTGYKQTHRTSYYSPISSYKSLPYVEYAFNRWYKKYDSYHTTASQAGLPKTISYNGTNRQHTLSNYKRGTPQTINTPQSLSTVSQTAYNVVDNNGWITKQTDYKGQCVNISYDNLGRMRAYSPCDTRFNPTTVDFSYTTGSEGFSKVAAGMLKQTVKTGNYQKDSYFDALSRPIFINERDITKVDTLKFLTNTYDSNNNLTFINHLSDTGNLSQGVSYRYDALGRQIEISDSTLLSSQSFVYKQGNKRTFTDNLNNATTTTYSAYGAPSYKLTTLIQSPENVTTSMSYNIFGDTTRITQGSVTETRLYDNYQALCKVIRPETGAFAYQYDAIGQLSYEAKGSSVSTATTSCDTVFSTDNKIIYTYDNRGQILKVNYGDSTPVLIFSYDKNGNVITTNSSQVAQNFTYNSLDKLMSETTSIDGKNFSMSYDINANGHISGVTYPNGYQVSFLPDAMGNPRAIKRVSNAKASAYNFATNIKYHAAGMISGFTYGNGIVEILDIDSRNLPIAKRASSSLYTPQDHRYSYDDNANIVSWHNNSNSHYSLNSISYDGLDRLVSVTGGSLIGNSQLSYDVLGNIKSYSSLNSNLSYAYDGKNRLSSVSGTGSASKNYPSFSYDSSGNITHNSHRGFTYNLAGHMVSSGGNQYVYDGANRRIKQLDSKGVSYSFYSKTGQLFYREKTQGGVNYIYLQGKLIAKDGVGNLTKSPLATPTASLNCSPSSCSQSKRGYGTKSITISALGSCTNGCDIEWFTAGHPFFNNDAGTNPKTYSFYCRDRPEEISGQVGVIVKDKKTGLKKIISKEITFTCSRASGGGGSEPLALKGARI